VLDEVRPQQADAQHFQKFLGERAKVPDGIVRAVIEAELHADPGIQVPCVLILKPFDEIQHHGQRHAGDGQAQTQPRPRAAQPAPQKKQHEQAERAEYGHEQQLPWITRENTDDPAAAFGRKLKGRSQAFVNHGAIIDGHIGKKGGQHAPADAARSGFSPHSGQHEDGPQCDARHEGLHDLKPRGQAVFHGHIEQLPNRGK